MEFNRPIGIKPGWVLAPVNLGHISLVDRNFDQAFVKYGKCIELCSEVDHKVFLAGSHFGLAGVLADQGKIQHAVEVLPAVGHLRNKTDFEWDAIDRTTYEWVLRFLREKASKNMVDAARA